jgi:hypothetical protein
VFGVVAMVGAPGHGGAGGNVAAASGPAAVGTSAPVPSSSTLAAQAQAPVAPAPTVSGKDMAGWLRQALAPYDFTGLQVLNSSGSSDMGGPYATLEIGYASGRGSASVNVARDPWSMQSLGSTLPPYISVTTLADGSHLMVFDGPEWPAGNGDPSAKRIDVSWYRNDGTMVTVEVLNEVQEKGATTASALGLTVDQATKVVQSPVWDKAIAAELAKPAPSVPSVPSGAKSSELQKKLVNSGKGQGSSTGSTAPSSQPSAPVSTPGS